MRAPLSAALGLALLAGPAALAPAQQAEVIPHAQDRPPGPALSPAEAIRKMTLPEGFAAEVVASEPDLVNPVAMTFDERGRVWVTESLEYPRREPGPGRDRVKVLEDTDGDGKADKFTIFAEGLNIPSGIAVGHGGVWVANSPDILFYPDADRDAKPDGPPEVVVTGFGRDDTHELPNSLTWGPDGWLYGWNGVFNQSHVRQGGRAYDFTCAIFRIHPKTRRFELFCEGTSNPWGIAINPEGSLFASACVIDHLWHLAETGYYHRQGGPYPPFTWKIESIVDHGHQKAAYCGVHYFDSPAYPPEFRDRLYMGNIHGNCINVDTLERDGSTYRGENAPDFLAANDAWFMPVVQKTGPDGCLYILDWYDRYHCYQDANRDPAGIDRLKGRLYRIRYQGTPRRSGFDLAKESDENLIKNLGNPNVYDRDIAQRLLTERLMHGKAEGATRGRLQTLVLAGDTPKKSRMHALWALVGGGPLDPAFHAQLLGHDDATLRAWGVRAAGNMGEVSAAIRDEVGKRAADEEPDVQLQAATAARKVAGVEPMAVLVAAASACGEDRLIPHIVWQNLHPLLDGQASAFVREVEKADLKESPALAAIVPRAIDRILAARQPDAKAVAGLLDRLIASGDEGAIRQGLDTVAARLRARDLPDTAADALKAELRRTLGPRADRAEYALLLGYCGDERGVKAAWDLVRSPDRPEDLRVRAVEVLVFSNASARELVRALFGEQAGGSAEFRGKALAALGAAESPQLAAAILPHYDGMAPELRPRAIELLTQRPAWSRDLVAAIEGGRIPKDAVNVNQIRRLVGSKDEQLAAKAKAIWGSVREGRNPQREQVVNRMREFLRKTPGDPYAGQQVFAKLCAQCHKIYGEGQEVGPDITGVGRSDFDQLVSNVFDPSLVIGQGYQATTVATEDGRVLTGLLAEDSKERVILKIQGGKQEVIPRAEVAELKVGDVSLMPENIEDQLKPEEWADLFAFLELDRQPADPAARRLPGTPEPKPRPRAAND